MPEPLESELAGVTLEIDALPQEDFPNTNNSYTTVWQQALKLFLKL
jgi:hypothetical protein